MHTVFIERKQWKQMGHLYSHLFTPPHISFGDNHELSITDVINIRGAQEINIDHMSFSRDPIMEVTDQSEASPLINPEAVLSSSSATMFLHFVLNGGGGYVDPGVKAEIIAAKEALANIGVSWVELLGTLKQENEDTKDVS
jgi:hypothetical protein